MNNNGRRKTGNNNFLSLLKQAAKGTISAINDIKDELK